MAKDTGMYWRSCERDSEASHGQGTIKKKVISAIKFKTYIVYASKEEPQYFDQERQDRPHGYAQRCRAHQDQSTHTLTPEESNMKNE